MTSPQQPPVEEQKATEAEATSPPEAEQPTGWPHQPIQELDEAERETLLQSGGPVGEAARVAWAQYETQQRKANEPQMGNDASGPNSGVGMSEVPAGPPPGVIPTAGASTANPSPPPAIPAPGGAPVGTGTGSTPMETGTTGSANAPVDTPEEQEAETGAQTEREQAEAKAQERGLEVRDYGTAGQWRVYDPATGQQVPKARLDEPV